MDLLPEYQPVLINFSMVTPITARAAGAWPRVWVQSSPSRAPCREQLVELPVCRASSIVEA